MNNYSNKLNKNNADLRLCIEKANNLPDMERAVLKFERDTNEGVLPDFYDWVSDKLYINIDSSMEEVNEYVKFIYESCGGVGTYTSLCGASDLETWDDVVGFELYVDSERDIYIIHEYENNIPIYVNRELSEDDVNSTPWDINFVGWRSEISKEISFEPNKVKIWYDINVEKLFSLKPHDEYPDGYIPRMPDRIYINKKLSDEELTLLLDSDMFLMQAWNDELIILFKTFIDGDDNLCLGYSTFNLASGEESSSTLLYNQSAGWNPDINSIEMPSSNLNMGGESFANKIFSSRPFKEEVEYKLKGEYEGISYEAKEDIDMMAFLENKEIPISITIPEGGIDLTVNPNTTIPKGEMPEFNDFVEKLYFNTSLSTEQVRDYVLEIANHESRFYTMPIFGYADESKGVYYTLYHAWESYMGYVMQENTIVITEHKWTGDTNNWETKWIYVSREITDDEIELWKRYSGKTKLFSTSSPNFVGWNPEFTYPVEINLNYNDSNYYEGSNWELIYGTHYKTDLSFILSKNPFDSVIVPSPIQPNEFVENIYFNTNLSVDDVLNEIIDKDRYVGIFLNSQEQVRVEWEPYSGYTVGDKIYLIKYTVGNSVDEILFISRNLIQTELNNWTENMVPDFIGWNPKLLDNPLEIKLVNNYSSSLRGFDNIVSTTSFKPFNLKLTEACNGEMVEINGNSNVVDLIPMIKENKIPTAIYFTGEIVKTLPSLDTSLVTESDIGKIYKYDNRLYTVKLDETYGYLSFKDIYMGTPMEVNELDESLLTTENCGHVYKCNDKLYVIENAERYSNDLNDYELLCNFVFMNDGDKFADCLTNFYKNNINYMTYKNDAKDEIISAGMRCYIAPFGIKNSQFYFKVSNENGPVASLGLVQNENYVTCWGRSNGGITANCPRSFEEVYCIDSEEVRYNQAFIDFLRQAFILRDDSDQTYYAIQFIELKTE